MEHLPVRQRSSEIARQMVLDPSPVPPSGGYLEINSADDGANEWNRWLQYWNALSRHKVAVVVATLCGLLLAFAVSVFQTPVYVSGTTLEFQAQASQQQPFEGVSAFDPYLLQTQAQLLRSDMLQGRVHTKMLQDRADPKLPARAQQGRALAPNPVRDWFGLPSTPPDWEQAITHATAALKVTPVKDSRIVQITSESTLPQVAADYVNTLATEFIQQNLEERWLLYQTTGTWLAKAQEDLKSQLEASEQQLLAYASASGLVVTSKDDNLAEQKLLQV